MKYFQILIKEGNTINVERNVSTNSKVGEEAWIHSEVCLETYSDSSWEEDIGNKESRLVQVQG